MIPLPEFEVAYEDDDGPIVSLDLVGHVDGDAGGVVGVLRNFPSAGRVLVAVVVLDALLVHLASTGMLAVTIDAFTGDPVVAQRTEDRVNEVTASASAAALDRVAAMGLTVDDLREMGPADLIARGLGALVAWARTTSWAPVWSMLATVRSTGRYRAHVPPRWWAPHSAARPCGAASSALAHDDAVAVDVAASALTARCHAGRSPQALALVS